LDDILIQETRDLDNWLRKKENDISKLGGNQEFQSALEDLINSGVDSDDYRTAYNLVQDNFISNNFDQFIFMDLNGIVRVATKTEWETLNLINEDYVNKEVIGKDDSSFIVISPAFLYPQIENPNTTISYNRNIILITSYQILDDLENSLGYILGISDVLAIQEVLKTNSGYLPESKIFLVTESGHLIGMTTLHGLVEIEPSDDQFEIIQKGPHASTSASAFNSYNDLEVFGLYEYYDNLNTGILVEAPQSKVFSQINSIAPFSILLIFITIIVIAVLVFFGTQRFTKPILKIVDATQKFAAGEWNKRTDVVRDDEIGLLAHTFNQMAEELSGLYQSMELQMEERSRQIITASEVGALATNSSSLEELLNQTVELLINRFNYNHAAIYLIDGEKENAILRGATGEIGQNLKTQGYQIPLNVNSIVGWAANNNAARISSDVIQDSALVINELFPETRAEVGIPISIGTQVLGVLNVHSLQDDEFTAGSVEVLTTLANQLATAIQNFRLLENTEIDLQQTIELYRASRRIAQANSISEIYQCVSEAVQQTAYRSALYISNEETLQLVENLGQSVYYADQLPKTLNIFPSQAQSYLESGIPTVIKNILQPVTSIHSELLVMPEKLDCQSAALLPIFLKGELVGLIIVGSQEQRPITQTSIQPFASLVDLVTTALEKLSAVGETQQRLEHLQIFNDISVKIGNETELQRLYLLIHDEVKKLIGDIDFYIALYDRKTDHIAIPYLYEGGVPIHIEPFPLGEGLTSIVVKSRQPLMLVENTEQRAKVLGAKIIGEPAKSWLGIPLLVGGEAVGMIAVQDLQREHRFSEEELVLLTTLASPIAGAIHSANLLEESERRTQHLQTAAEIARDTSSTLDRDQLLKRAVNLVQDQFNFYHASVFLLDDAGEYAVVSESTGDAGRQLMVENHKLKVGSKSIIGHVTANGEPLIVNDVSQDPTHHFNPLLPDTRAELGIPLMIGEQVLGALDVQSTIPFAFSEDDVSVLQILADQLAVAVINADLYTETQEHLAQHRLIHHVTTVAASSSGIDDALSSAVQGLRVTLGVRVTILLVDPHEEILRVHASSGYEDDILGLQIKIGEGITGWVAEKQELLLVNDVLDDPRYIPGKDTVRSELAVPLVYRGSLLGVLNIESDELNAFGEHDQDTLGTLAGSLSAIIMNAQLSERQQQLFEVTTKIRRSINMETILETTAEEISKVLKTRKTRIQIGGDYVLAETPEDPGDDGSQPQNGQEGEE
jgi:GAF domain-containing protein/HAMP domain-containing protein